MLGTRPRLIPGFRVKGPYFTVHADCLAHKLYHRCKDKGLFKGKDQMQRLELRAAIDRVSQRVAARSYARKYARLDRRLAELKGGQA